MKNSLISRYLFLSGLVLLLALLGYTGFILYQQMIRSSAVGSGLVLLAIVAGIASLFSPCSFPLLVTLLAREARKISRRHMLHTAVAFTLGVILFLSLLGAALALGAGSFISQFTFTSDNGRLLRASVGLLLIGLGFWQIRGQSLNWIWLTRLLQPLWRKQSHWQRHKTTVGYGLYGFGYILAGFG